MLDYYARRPRETSDPDLLRRAFATATQPLPFQFVGGEHENAEKSFFKINSSPAIIDKTELDVIKARRKPNAIATRALVGAGTGHKLKLVKAEEISELSCEVYRLLFGEIVELGAHSPDVPRAGQPYSGEAFKMILDMVNLFNGITPSMWQESGKPASSSKRSNTKTAVTLLPNDVDGDETLRLLRKVKEIARLTCDYDYEGSLGLDQAVYSYGKAGKFHSSAFIASLQFAKELWDKNQRYIFTKIREPFEEFLVRHKSFINDLGHSKGSRLRALESFLLMYRIIMSALRSGITDDAEIIARLKAEQSLKSALKEADSSIDENATGKKFSRGAVPRLWFATNLHHETDVISVKRDCRSTQGQKTILGI
jgi:hypothetical protein